MNAPLQKEKTEQEQRQSEVKIAAAEVIARPQQDTNSPENEGSKTENDKQDTAYVARKWKECDATDRYMVYLTLVLAAFTVALLLLTKSQVSAAKEKDRRELRAYISVLPPEIEGDILANPLKITYCSENAGQTPAYEIQEKATVKIMRNDDVKNIEDPHNWSPDGTEQVINPGIKIERYIAPSEEPKSHVGLSTKDYRIIVWGKVIYKDTYGMPHWTTFCFRYNWERHKFTADGGHTGLFNDADKDYKNNK